MRSVVITVPLIVGLLAGCSSAPAAAPAIARLSAADLPGSSVFQSERDDRPRPVIVRPDPVLTVEAVSGPLAAGSVSAAELTAAASAATAAAVTAATAAATDAALIAEAARRGIVLGTKGESGPALIALQASGALPDDQTLLALQARAAVNGPGPADIPALIRAAFPVSEGDNAIRVATCESGLKPWAIGKNDSSFDFGVFQVNYLSTGPGLGLSIPDAFTATANIAAARRLWESRGWQPWTCARLLGIWVPPAPPATPAPTTAPTTAPATPPGPPAAPAAPAPPAPPAPAPTPTATPTPAPTPAPAPTPTPTNPPVPVKPPVPPVSPNAKPGSPAVFPVG